MSFPDKKTVMAFLEANPHITTRRDIAKGLNVKGDQRAQLRAVLKDLERDGEVERRGKRRHGKKDQLPPTTLVSFLRIDEHGDLIGKAKSGDGLFGPDLIYSGPAHRAKGGRDKARQRDPGIGDVALCKITEGPEGFQARVIKVLDKRENEPVIGLFTSTRHGGRVESVNRRDKYDLLIERQDMGEAADGDLVRVMPKPSRGHGPKLAIVQEVIGKVGDPRAASLIALHAHGIPTEFPEAALEQARKAKPAPAEREDLTQIPLITIDPADARDHDDAVYAEQLEDGWRVIVAIADVSAYVTEGSALDREAYKRGNSTYFPDRVVPMLPFELSADECSLKEGELRRCLAVEMEFDKAGTKRSHRFVRGMMKSAAGLSYEEAQTAIDGHPNDHAGPLLEPVLKPLWGAYAAVNKAREQRAPLDLDLPERRIEFAEDGTIHQIAVKDRFDAHKLIEEFMIQANVAAAESLEKARHPLIYRVHDQPTDAKLAALAEYLKTLDIKWALGERPQTHRFNRLLADSRDGETADMITEIVLRSQAQAVYAPENLGHFGLNLNRYAHFTSPIRRYADLIVHRALISALGLGPDGMSKESLSRLEETATHITTTERRSMAAERDATDRYLALFLQDRVGAEFEGRITGVTKAGLFVRLAETAADGFIPISSLSSDFWDFDDVAMRLVARGSGKHFDLGQTVSVRLKEVSPLQGGLLLEMLSPPRAGERGARPGRSRPAQGRGRGGAKSARHKGGKGKRRGR
ncbi:MAG: ribonuclease R [Hyphomonadaceae bacterium]|nr:ribonuclease R [Hyphomonadaceae bacterium]